MEPPTIKFGILGAANIARKNVRSILLSKNCELIGQPLLVYEDTFTYLM